MSAIFDRTYSFRSTSAVVHCAKKLERPDRVVFCRSAYGRYGHRSGHSEVSNLLTKPEAGPDQIEPLA